ncbi:MAG: nucleotide exchange factor GrpE [Bacteroidetes bacterium HGW-Bacteroidetes-12]|nr:MAG: nucleotide exchange factor GrpE [Bacteroidetes bacterium HGW-Bacteroidetes-12]
MSTKEKEEKIVENEARQQPEAEIADNEKENLTIEEELEIKLKEANDKFLRLYSDFDNFRKRTQKEKLDLYKTAGEEIITALLPILDDFERASKAMQDAKDIDSVKDGMKLIHEKMLSILKQKGLEPTKSQVGEPFNVEFHEAITQIPAPSKKEVGKVIDEVEKGYSLNGKVIRYTKVVVGQ